MKRRFAALTLVITVAGLFSAGVVSTSAVGVSILTTPIVELVGETNPAKLPRTTPKPIILTLEGKISEPGTAVPPPALKNLSLHFDRGGAIFTKGLATCSLGELTSEIEPTVRPLCRKALVGQGEVEIEVEDPEQPAFHTEGPMAIFNGVPRGGHPVLIFEAHVHVPAPTTYIASGVIRGDGGKYGTQTTIQIPSFVSGYGSLTGFRAKIGRTWTHKGKEVSLITAHCQNGSLAVRGEFDLVSGDKLEGDIIQPCRPA